MRKNTLLTVAGLALFAGVVGKIGLHTLIPRIAAVWTGLPLIVALSIVRLLIQSRAWAIALRTEGIEATTGALAGIRLVSQGAGYISVLGPAISEPMKIRLLRSTTGSAAVATLVDTGTYWFASGLFGVVGCLVAGLLVAHSWHTAIVLAMLAAVFTVGLILIARPKPLLSPLIRALGARCPGWLRKGEQVETAIRAFAVEHPGSLRKMFWLDFACQVLLAAEVAAVFWVLRIPLHAGAVLALEAANRGVKIATGWMPARVGADEGATAGMFVALGLPSASGLVLALTRRTRDLLACLVGFAWFAWYRKFNASDQRELATCKQ